MFGSQELQSYFDSSYTVQTQPLVIAEINQNAIDNIERIGTYRYRPNGMDARYRSLPQSFDAFDQGDHYTDAEISYAEIGGTYESGTDLSQQTIFRQTDQIDSIYSLSDCFRHNRPRSGINKMLYLGQDQFIDNGSVDPSARPRFYMSSKDDYFKYWTSFRNEGDLERGISYGSGNFIDDTVPFVVYKNPIPANRIVVKMQTLAGTISNGTGDPFFENLHVPARWRIEVLRNGSWFTARSFTGASSIGADGHVSIAYGLTLPDNEDFIYKYIGEVADNDMLPLKPVIGDTYLVNPGNDIGELWTAVEIGGVHQWSVIPAQYGWVEDTDGIDAESLLVTDLVNPQSYGMPKQYRQFQVIEGIRIVVDSMRLPDSTFDLIELSPRLVMDWTDITPEFSVSKMLADLSGSATPVGSLMASTGSITVSNVDAAFDLGNTFDPIDGTGSVLSNWPSRAKISFYDTIIKDNMSYVVPVKTLYTETSPALHNSSADVQFELRDLYFLLESMNAPSLLMTNVSLSYAVMTLLDNIGFVNYSFRRDPDVADPVIPFFFVPQDKSVAQVLADLAAATQSAMYFDEFNNFIVSTKEYVLPEPGARSSNSIARAADDANGLANIIEISSADKQVYNAGSIDYTKRYIQRTYGSLNQALYQPNDKTWIYAPTMLWEVSGDSATKATNDAVTEQSTYTLTAMPLSTVLTNKVPTVQDGALINNTMNVGESANYVARYKGYLYANGEIIKYDAVQYAVTGTGNVWIRSADEYQNYLLSLPFGGKIYPTGLIRIWAEPYYNGSDMQTGSVKHHGRGQFDTQIVAHNAGVPDEWTTPDNVAGIMQNSDPLFNMRSSQFYQNDLYQNAPAGRKQGANNANVIAKASTRNGIMKNNLSQTFWSDSDINQMTSAQVGTLQSSALVFNGPDYPVDMNPRNHVSYVHKHLSDYYTNFGTRCRIIGKVETGSTSDQTPTGATNYFAIPNTDPSTQTYISGGSGGIAIHVDPETNAGYFFEIAALTKADPTSYQVDEIEFSTVVGNVINAKIENDLVTVALDIQDSAVVVDVNVGDMITISDFYGGTDFPTLNGTHRVESVDGNDITFAIQSSAYTWQGLFGTVKHDDVDLGPITATGITDAGIATFVFVYPTGLSAGDLLGTSDYDVPSSVTDINVSGIKVITVNSDSRIITAMVPKFTGESAPEDPGVLSRVNYEQPELSNIWFYKTVADDKGGIIRSFSRSQSEFKVVVPSHRFSKYDQITITVPGNPNGINGQYRIESIVGTSLFLDGRGTDASSDSLQDNGHNTIGLTDPVATTYKLWSGLSNILVDSGQFWGQYRAVAEEKSTVYDMNVEFIDSSRGRTFYLYLNNRQIATVFDPQPLAKVNNMALFVRGQTRMMFENVFALGENIAGNSVAKQVAPESISEVFGIPDGINESDALRKYAVSGFVQSSFLSGVGSQNKPQYNMYYEEFGTIMREAAYFNIKYDKAYPALYARMAPVLNRMKGYTMSGFLAGAYGAEFLIFNNLDNVCDLDASTGNYLRIQGVTFTQSTSKTLTVDEFMSSVDPAGDGRQLLTSPDTVQQLYDDIKISRLRYGKNDFTLSSEYIQSDDAANSLMEWILSKITRPRKNVGMSIFANPLIQLGDILSIDYKNDNGEDIISSIQQQFVVYSIEFSRSAGSTSMTIYVTEV